MAIPPFPSQEVAKLVLGYLAEEDLMTAYDEFLQASPYLDAFSNEYGRVFMTSLKNILAEYMAIKIYVESCKPITLRRKLMQCSNLLEVIKLLIALVDVQKANFQEKPRIFKQNVSKFYTSCDICGSSDTVNCLCNSVPTNIKSYGTCVADVIESSVETTLLSDLPGNAVIRENVQNVVSPAITSVKISESNSSECNMNQRTKTEKSSVTDVHLNSVTSSTTESNNTICLPQSASLMINTDTSRQNLEEFDTILNKVTKESNNTTVLPSSTILCTGPFKDTAGCVPGTTEENNYNTDHTPDSNKYLKNDTFNSNIIGLPQDIITASSSDPSISKESQMLNLTEEKGCEQKIKIISDIKVNNNAYTKIPPILKSKKNAPLVQMQTLYINGTCAYKNNMQSGTNFNYTKDEIMAMPTIIVLPSSGSTGNPQIVPKSTEIVNFVHSDTANNVQPHVLLGPIADNQNLKSGATTASNVNTIHDSEATAKVKIPKISALRPLTIDVADKGAKKNNVDSIDYINNIGLVKTVDNISESLPKEIIQHKITTPTVVPPMKKSSSTPRRTSHIRVLDFTTPRRILNENSTEININEQTIQIQQNPIVTNIPHCNISSKYVPDQDRSKKNPDENKLSYVSQSKISSVKKFQPKKPNWDADLRAQISQSDINLMEKYRKVNKKRTSKENGPNKNVASEIKRTKKAKNINSSKIKDEGTLSLKKNNKKLKETVSESQDQVKTSTNVASQISLKETPIQNEEKNHTKINNNQIEQSDTPEAERQALQNAIGAKLNISDLLETPYKQALYDIQMETPRFFGPDVPDEPMSDIKIMNIPTPRFFDTPKITQATPSSYSSRQTDYSSGGSYYKPDDQDYIPISEVLECAISVCSEDTQKEREKPANKESSPEVVQEKLQRPVRKCTKNVSYRKSSKTKTKEDASLSKNTDFYSETDRKPTKKTLPKSTPSRKLKTVPPTILKDTKSPVKLPSPVKLQSPVKLVAPKKVKNITRATPVKEMVSKRNRKLSNDSKTLCVAENQTKKKISKDKINATLTAAAPTKSRRKSATPRKLHCTKSFNTDNNEHNVSADLSKNKDKEGTVKETKILGDSDSEQLPLRWSDDGSQDTKSKEVQQSSVSQNEEDDIDNIKRYIENCNANRNKCRLNTCKMEPKQNFDVETAKIIERDLLDTPPRVPSLQVIDITNSESSKPEISVSSQSHNINIDGGCDRKNQGEILEEDEEEIELTESNCNEETKNYFSYVFNESSFVQNNNLSKIKDKFCIELCIEDDISIRLNATALSTVFEQDPGEVIVDDSYEKETATAISSISNMEKLYTPMKSNRNQYIDIFDSTLTSLDTPLKKDDPKDVPDSNVTEIILEIESIQCKDKTDVKKRKRSSNVANESGNAKKLKSETQELLKSANIQNIDIESVLSKLHGP